MKKYKDDQRQRNWEMFVSYHGGIVRCERCRYEGIAIDYHHLIPSQKKGVKDTLAANISLPQEKFMVWVQNTSYALLCKNCHAELHAGIWEIADIAETIVEREARQTRTKIYVNSRANERLLDAILSKPYEKEVVRNTSKQKREALAAERTLAKLFPIAVTEIEQAR